MAVNPYNTALELGRPVPAVAVSTDDRARLQAYGTYADIFNNVKEAFAGSLRDDVDQKSKRYAAVARGIVEATNRYFCNGLDIVVEFPASVTAPSPEAATETVEILEALFKREEFPTKFASMKRWFLIKGDGILHISADPSKPEGTRIRLTELEPDQYFPVYDPGDSARVTGAYVVTVLTKGNEEVAQRIEYRRIFTPEDSALYGAPVGSIWTRIGFYEVGGWDDRFPEFTVADLKPVEVPEWIPMTEALAVQMQGVALPAQITAIPLYHFRNNRTGNEPFGRSELQGIESLLAGVTQNVTDEDMAVALVGLGVYWTDSGKPLDANGEEEDWVIAPASIIELADGKKFGRADGITTVQPNSDHIDRLKAEAREATGVPDVAIGKIQTAEAESGISLAIKMSPMVAKNAEKETEVGGRLDQLLFDLWNGWYPAYEGVGANGAIISSVFGPMLPTNRKELLAEVTGMVTAGIIDAAFARELLAEGLGITFPGDLTERMAAAAQTALDAMGGRLDAAASGEPL